MIAIRLPNSTWSYDPDAPLAKPGGFGVVYAGCSADGTQVAIKLLKLSATEAAHRELRMAEFLHRDFNHVLEVYDAGQDADSDQYFIVMPRADRSLQSVVESVPQSPLDDKDVAEILSQIVRGLDEVPQIIHRDLKPANILLHGGVWKIADFGTARFVEEATSARTLKSCLSPPYAAPEQWKFERATPKTDMYSLGCICFALLTGKPPFQGPSEADFCQQHLNAAPPDLVKGGSQLRSLVQMLLRKNPPSRPSRQRVTEILGQISRGIGTASVGAVAALSDAGARYARAETEKEARLEQERQRNEERKAISVEGTEILRALVNHLHHLISANVPAAKLFDKGAQSFLNCGNGTIEFDVRAADGLLGLSASGKPWPDLFAFAQVRVHQVQPPYVWSASLLYMKTGEQEDPRWYEVSYFGSHRYPQTHADEPYSLPPHDALNVSPHVLGRHRIAYGPCAIDDENEAEFCERWISLLARAMDGRLHHPHVLPLQSGWWRSR